MITTCTGRDVADLLRKVRDSAWQFSEVTLCSPFIGEDEAQLITQLILDGPKSGCAVRVITTRSGGMLLKQLVPLLPISARRRILVRRGLHAKFYLALSRRPRSSEVIVTSANLTSAGLSENLELGVHATNDCDDGVQLVHKVANYAQRLAA
jgi:HKD family nuclease